MGHKSEVKQRLLGVCLGGSCAAFLATVIAPAAQAQQIAPSQVTPQSLRPESVPSATIVLPEAAGLAAPANAQKLSVDVGQVVVEGAFPELAAETRALAAGLEGRRVSVAQIYAVANAIEQRYAAAGFVLARVAVPPQKLGKHATLHLVLIDGFVEAVDVKGVPERQRAVIAGRMAALVGQRHLHLTDIERRLLLVSDLPGVSLKSTLARGSQPGGTLLVLEAEQHYVSGTIGVDNRLPGSLGTWELNSSLALNSAFGFGEQIYGSASTGADLSEAFDGKSPLRVLGGGAVLPIGPDGFTLNPEYTDSITRQRPVPGAPPSQGAYDRFAVRANYPVIRTREQSLSL
jgi:hemolysin activation/secretion protein